MKENALSLLQTLLPLKSTNQRERRPKLFIGLSPSNHTVETRHIIIIIIISLTENRVETGFLAPHICHASRRCPLGGAKSSNFVHNWCFYQGTTLRRFYDVSRSVHLPISPVVFSTKAMRQNLETVVLYSFRDVKPI